MSLRFRYFLYIILLHILIAGLVFYVLKEHLWIFIFIELLLIGSMYLGFRIYVKMLKPIQLMQSGTNAILDNDFSIKYVETGSKDLDNLIMVYNKMIDQLREEKTKVQSQGYFLESLIEASPIGIVILDFDDKITIINPTARKILGLKNNAVNTFLNAAEGVLASRLSDLPIGTKKLISINATERYHCSINKVIHQGFNRKFILIEDLSNEIIKAEKEAYGKIIRMMSHEINNSIGAINSILQTVMEYGFDEQNQDLADYLAIAIKRNTNLCEFTDNYAAILRLPEPNMTSTNLNDLLFKSIEFWKSTATKLDIDVTFKPLEGTVINCDPILMEQVISNIIKNAIQSIGENGTISVEVKAKGFVISDNGPGIDPAIVNDLFTPFFSTKQSGQGIGLMLIKEILSKHNCTYQLTTDKEDITGFVVGF